MSAGQIPQDDNYKPVLALMDDATGQVIPLHVGAKVTGADGNKYAKLDVDVTVSVDPANPQRVNAQSGDFVSGSIADLTTLLTDMTELLTDTDNLATLAGAISGSRMLIGVSTATLFTTTQTAQGGGNSGDLDVSKLREVSIDINTTAQAGTNPTIQFFYERKGADGIYYVLWQSAVLSAASNTLSTSVGAGMAYNQSLGPTGRLRWVVGGTASPNWTFTPNVYGK